jgi:hypothetical protein
MNVSFFYSRLGLKRDGNDVKTLQSAHFDRGLYFNKVSQSMLSGLYICLCSDKAPASTFNECLDTREFLLSWHRA